MSSTSSPAEDPEYFAQYKNFALSRSTSGVLTLRFHTDGGPHTFDGTTHHDLPRLLEDIAFDSANRVLVITGTGDSFTPSTDGPSLGDLTKPMGFDVMYTEGRRWRDRPRSPAAGRPGDPDHRGGQRPRAGCTASTRCWLTW
jgi:enoyl-CoA hydratase/carnithine racemase